MAVDAESPDTWRIDLNQIRPEIFSTEDRNQGQNEGGPGLLRAGTGAVNFRLGDLGATAGSHTAGYCTLQSEASSVW